MYSAHFVVVVGDAHEGNLSHCLTEQGPFSVDVKSGIMEG